MRCSEPGHRAPVAPDALVGRVAELGSLGMSNMSIPSTTFFIDGPCEDPAYLSTRDHPRGGESTYFVEELWRRFYHLSYSPFREDARTHFHQRFWEMYLAVTLLEHDFDLKRYGDEGPEFYAM